MSSLAQTTILVSAVVYLATLNNIYIGRCYKGNWGCVDNYTLFEVNQKTIDKLTDNHSNYFLKQHLEVIASTVRYNRGIIGVRIEKPGKLV